MSDKFPYPNFTYQELLELERSHYILVMGGDAVSVDGVYTHTKSEVQRLHKVMLEDLIDMVNEGLTDKGTEITLLTLLILW